METNRPATSIPRGPVLGLLSFLSAIAAAGSITMIGFTSFTAFNPPGWLRIATMAPLPFAILLSFGFGVAGLRTGSGRIWAIAGMVIAVLSIVAFAVMLSRGG